MAQAILSDLVDFMLAIAAYDYKWQWFYYLFSLLRLTYHIKIKLSMVQSVYPVLWCSFLINAWSKTA